MTAPVHYEGGGFVVTDSVLKTPRRSFDLAAIQYVSLRRPLFVLVSVVTIGLLGFAAVFWRYLYTSELTCLITLSLLALVISYQVGLLRVHSLALRDGDLGAIPGRFARLRAVKAHVEKSMEARGRTGHA